MNKKANSLGTGEASERIFVRTHGLPPYPPGPLGQFIVRNSTSLILRLHRWKTAGCPIKAFRIQYRSENSSLSSTEEKSVSHRWTVLNKELNNPWTNKEPALLQINHLQPNTVYSLQVQAKSDAGITEEEYIVRTLNRTEVYYESDDDSNDLMGHNEHNIFNPDETAYVYRQFALLLPVAASIFVLLLLVIFMFVCLRKQTVRFPGMQLDRFALPLNAKSTKEASFLANQAAHEQLVLSEYQKLNCPSTLNTNSSTLPLDNCSYPELCSNNSNVNNQLNTSNTIKKYFNNHLTDACDQMNSTLLLGNTNDNTYSKMCTTNSESLYYSSPLRKSAANLVDCCTMNNLNNLNNLANGMTNDSSMIVNDELHQTVDPLVGLILKGVQSNHDYAEPYAKQARCLIDSQDMVLLPAGTFCTNGQHQSQQQLDNAFNYALNKSTQNISTNPNYNKAQQLRMVRINNSCQNALTEQIQQTYATVKRKSNNQRTNTGLKSAQSANFNLLNQNSLEQ